MFGLAREIDHEPAHGEEHGGALIGAPRTSSSSPPARRVRPGRHASFQGRGPRIGTIGFGAGVGTGASMSHCDILLESQGGPRNKAQGSLTTVK